MFERIHQRFTKIKKYFSNNDKRGTSTTYHNGWCTTEEKSYRGKDMEIFDGE